MGWAQGMNLTGIPRPVIVEMWAVTDAGYYGHVQLPTAFPGSLHTSDPG